MIAKGTGLKESSTYKCSQASSRHLLKYKINKTKQTVEIWLQEARIEKTKTKARADSSNPST